ncbi:MAG: undecaprenyl-phosphate galactose phosphotransferase WbaP [Limnohabitans sp.]|nr:undecaprenyl-phosphate galactose phosphotransferase WbaP [Limnohabitans sp.]
MIHTLSLFQVRVSKFAILLGDVIAFAVAFTLATLINVALNPEQNISAWFSTQDMQRYVAWSGLVFLGLMLFLMRFQHYSDRRPFWDELGDILRLVGSLALLDMTLVASTRWNSSRLWWLLVWVLAVAMIVWGRMATRWMLKQMGLWIRPTIIIGHGENASEAAIALESEPRMGFEVGGYVNVDESSPRLRLNGDTLLNLHQLETLADQPGIQWVIALEHAQSEQREHWLRTLTQWGATDISVIPAMRGVPLYGTDIAHFFSHEVALLRVRNNLRRWPARLTKRLFDTSLAAFLLILISPLMLLIALALKMEGGSVLFAHQRVGKNGRKFYCYKFRSMVPNADQQLQLILQQNPDLSAEWHKEHKLKDDPRVSKVGDFLRRTSLDELPQLFNVLKSEMSLVGPRPIVQDELQKYGLEKSYYLMVRPGMTGLWQVSGRNNVDYETRVYLDAWYVKNWSLWYDLAILFKTIKVVFWRNGAY